MSAERCPDCGQAAHASTYCPKQPTPQPTGDKGETATIGSLAAGKRWDICPVTGEACDGEDCTATIKVHGVKVLGCSKVPADQWTVVETPAEPTGDTPTAESLAREVCGCGACRGKIRQELVASCLRGRALAAITAAEERGRQGHDAGWFDRQFLDPEFRKAYEAELVAEAEERGHQRAIRETNVARETADNKDS